MRYEWDGNKDRANLKKMELALKLPAWYLMIQSICPFRIGMKGVKSDGRLSAWLAV